MKLNPLCPICKNQLCVQIEEYEFICVSCGITFSTPAKDQQSRGIEVKHMVEQTNPWEAALGGKFVKFENDEPKVIVVTSWSIREIPKDAYDASNKVVPGQKELKWAFVATCIEEDNVPCDKVLEMTSKPFMIKCRPIFEGRPSTDKFKLSVVKIGDGVKTQYSVKELK